MLCPVCGKEVGEEQVVCASCQQNSEPVHAEGKLERRKRPTRQYSHSIKRELDELVPAHWLKDWRLLFGLVLLYSLIGFVTFVTKASSLFEAFLMTGISLGLLLSAVSMLWIALEAFSDVSGGLKDMVIHRTRLVYRIAKPGSMLAVGSLLVFLCSVSVATQSGETPKEVMIRMVDMVLE